MFENSTCNTILSLILYFYLPVQNTENGVRRVLEPPQYLLHKLIFIPTISELNLHHFLLNKFQIRRPQKPQALLIPYVQHLRVRIIAEPPEGINRRHELALLEILLRQGNRHQPDEGAPAYEKRVPVEEAVDGNQNGLNVDFSGVFGGDVSYAGKLSEKVEEGE